MKKIIDAMDKGIGMLEKIVLFGSITVMLIVTAIEVLDAKVLHANLMWTTEVNRIMLVWCILSGASVAAGTRSHLGVEFLVRKMPKKIAKWVVLFTDLICIFVSGYVVASGIALVSMQIRLGSVYSITRWPTAVGELAVPVCFAQRRKVKDFFIKFKKKSHFADFLTEQTLDFVLHRLFCGLAEMHTDDIGCLADLLSDSRASGGVGCGIVHSKSSCK